GVGVLLVRAAFAAVVALELHARLLLHHVRRFVRRRVQARRARERDLISGGKRFGAHRLRAFGRCFAGVRLYSRHVVPAERALNRVAVGHRPAAARHAALGGRLHAGVALPAATLILSLAHPSLDDAAGAGSAESLDEHPERPVGRPLRIERSGIGGGTRILPETAFRHIVSIGYATATAPVHRLR